MRQVAIFGVPVFFATEVVASCKEVGFDIRTNLSDEMMSPQYPSNGIFFALLELLEVGGSQEEPHTVQKLSMMQNDAPGQCRFRGWVNY
jgi:hypothetical protein